jgi:hypothetical protein
MGRRVELALRLGSGLGDYRLRAFGIAEYVGSLYELSVESWSRVGEMGTRAGAI